MIAAVIALVPAAQQTSSSAVTTAESERGSHQRLSAGETPPRSEPKCRSARFAAIFYRLRTHSWQTLREGKLATRSPIVLGKSCHWAKFAAREWKARARSARRSYWRWFKIQMSVPVGEAELRAYINDDCLEEIIDRESAGTWSPTVRNYSDGIAYGLPQARPGYKMASAGADWRTNPKTQIAWMRGYVNDRYGGSCGALAHHNANGWY